ncbi:MAG: cytochrome c peroxidase [Rhizomicrobium sp.]|jgi:cytochrome c peroxidase
MNNPSIAKVAPRILSVAALAIVAVVGGATASTPNARVHSDAYFLARGINPHPVKLDRPPVEPLSAMAELGRKLFFDPNLSGSGKLSCSSCHDPAHAYGPPGTLSVMIGGSDMHTAGFRAVPSLGYLYRQPAFHIAPDNSGDDAAPNLQHQASLALNHTRVLKSAAAPQAAAANLVPQGGLFWDGRADTLQQQANGPLFNPAEMAASAPEDIARKLEHDYAEDFHALFGPNIFDAPKQAVAEAMFAIGRYQIEEPGFHPFTSKYDSWLAGRARFTASEARGFLAFNDPMKGNCAACHLSKPTQDGLPPLFTDYQYEALGVPRNTAIPANSDPDYFDLGICGPYRTNMSDQTQYCGMFLTPSLRNTAARQVFFHNGVFHSLEAVLDWYVNRDLQPERFYSREASGTIVKYDDLPTKFRTNVDTADAPFDRRPGDRPALSKQEMRDIVAFLRTLNDGYVR